MVTTLDRTRRWSQAGGVLTVHDALARLANDPGFADQLRTDPAKALKGYDLSAADLARLERIIAPWPLAPVGDGARRPSQGRALGGGVVIAATAGLAIGILGGASAGGTPLGSWPTRPPSVG